MTRSIPLLCRTSVMAVLAVVLVACSSGTVVLLPEKDGHATSVVVKQGDRELVLDQPYAAATQTSLGPKSFQSSAHDVESDFGAALAAQPMRSTQFTLYFVEGTDEFTDDSKRMVESVFSEIAKHPVPDLLVVGHTDAVGNDQDNDLLSRQRADTVRTALIDRGIAPDNIVAIGRGKRELMVSTADGVAEPRNRRVVIVVR